MIVKFNTFYTEIASFSLALTHSLRHKQGLTRRRTSVPIADLFWDAATPIQLGSSEQYLGRKKMYKPWLSTLTIVVELPGIGVLDRYPVLLLLYVQFFRLLGFNLHYLDIRFTINTANN